MFQKSKYQIANQTKTLLCVTIAGLFFVPAVIFNIWYLVLIGAFFDWLPLPTGWMKLNKAKPKNKKMILLHILITLIAYFFVVIWIFIPTDIYKFLFLEIWWLAVIIGIFITKQGEFSL